jgi:hypothetical protein
VQSFAPWSPQFPRDLYVLAVFRLGIVGIQELGDAEALQKVRVSYMYAMQKKQLIQITLQNW